MPRTGLRRIDRTSNTAPTRSKLKSRLQEIFDQATAEEWFTRLGAKDCCVAPVRHLKDALPDYPTEPIPALSDTPGRAEGRAPRLGEHNQELL